MNEFNTIVALLGGLIVALGLASKTLAKSPVPPTLIALVIGIVVGPEVLNLINLEEMGDRSTLLERAARLTLGIGLIVALRVPREFPRANWRGMLVLVGLGMRFSGSSRRVPCSPRSWFVRPRCRGGHILRGAHGAPPG